MKVWEKIREVVQGRTDGEANGYEGDGGGGAEPVKPVKRRRGKGMLHGERRKQVYDYLVEYKRAHDGNSPSIRDIVRGVGLTSSSTVWYHLRGLVEEGKIRLDGGRDSRSIEVVGGKWTAPEGAGGWNGYAMAEGDVGAASYGASGWIGVELADEGGH